MSQGARTTRTFCPTCQGTVQRSEGTRADRCPFCHHRSLVFDDNSEVLRYSLAPSLDSSSAVSTAKHALVEQRVTARRLLDLAKFAEPTLYYVPFLWSTGTTPYLETRATTISAGREHVDTKVAIEDFEVFELAVDIKKWGLRTLDISALMAKPHSPLPQPYDSTALRRHGCVLVPQRGFNDGLDRLDGKLERMTSSNDDVVERVAERRRILWIPIWIVAFTIRGQRYEARLDAVDGKLLSARSPEDERIRIPMALGALLLPCFLVGKLLRFGLSLSLSTWAMAGLTNPVFLLGFGLGALVALSAFLSILAFSWSLLRYEAVHLYRDGLVWSEQLGRPELTLLDRLTNRIGNLLSGLTGES